MNDEFTRVMSQVPSTLKSQGTLLTPEQAAVRIGRSPGYIEWLVDEGHVKAKRRWPTRIESIELETFLMSLRLDWSHPDE